MQPLLNTEPDKRTYQHVASSPVLKNLLSKVNNIVISLSIKSQKKCKSPNHVKNIRDRIRKIFNKIKILLLNSNSFTCFSY